MPSPKDKPGKVILTHGRQGGKTQTLKVMLQAAQQGLISPFSIMGYGSKPSGTVQIQHGSVAGSGFVAGSGLGALLGGPSNMLAQSQNLQAQYILGQMSPVGYSTGMQISTAGHPFNLSHAEEQGERGHRIKDLSSKPNFSTYLIALVVRKKWFTIPAIAKYLFGRGSLESDTVHVLGYTSEIMSHPDARPGLFIMYDHHQLERMGYIFDWGDTQEMGEVKWLGTHYFSVMTQSIISVGFTPTPILIGPERYESVFEELKGDIVVTPVAGRLTPPGGRPSSVEVEEIGALIANARNLVKKDEATANILRGKIK